MAIQQITIYNGNLASNSENLSSVFTQGLGFYLIAPASTFEYQIDVYLQVRVSNTTIRQVRLNPLNVSTTQRITLIPPQIVELGLPMQLAIVPSQEFLLEIILLQNDCGLCSLTDKIDTNTILLQEIAEQSQSNNADLLLELIPQLLQLDAGITTIVQGISRLLPQTERQNTAQISRFNRNFS